MRGCAGWRTILGLAILAPSVRADPPAWLKEAELIPTPPSAAGAPAVVLLDESTLSVDATGMVTETHRYALRVLHDAGRKHAHGDTMYDGASAKVTETGAWLLRKGRQIEERLSRQWADVSAEASGAAIDEMRQRNISLSNQALTDDVFGYQTEVVRPLLVGQLWFEFGGVLPCVKQSATLILPDNFLLAEQGFGPVKPEFLQTGTRQKTWSVIGQPYRPAEPNDAGIGRIDAALMLDLTPPESGARKFKPYRFASWAEVATLCNNLNVAQCDTNPALAAQARALVAGAADPLDKIRRIGRHVQQLRYIALNRGLRYGYGWRARKATEVLATGYGDCKDKANFMVALLREVGIPAYLVLARLDPDRMVRAEFPSPLQFNHAIVGIPVDAGISLPAIAAIPGRGPVLFFDPTDSFSEVGDLSFSLQGSSVFFVAAGEGQLTALPVFPAQDAFRTERQMKLEFAENGELKIAGRITGSRQSRARLRAAFQEAAEPQELDKLVTSQLNARLKAASIIERKTEDDAAADRSALVFQCVQAGYMQPSASTTPVLKIDVLSRTHIPSLSESTRRLPVELMPSETLDEMVVRLPDGFVVGEVPADFSLRSDFGEFSINYHTSAEGLVLRRRLVFDRRVVPAADYAKLRQFLTGIARADRNAIMLKRQAGN